MKKLLSSCKKFLSRRFPTYRSKILVSLLLCGLLPLGITVMTTVRYTVRNGREQVLGAVYQSDSQLTMEINNRMSQINSVLDSLQYNMYTIANPPSNVQEQSNAVTTRNAMSLYKSTFNLLHIFAFLPSDNIVSHEGVYFFSLDDLLKFEVPDKMKSDSVFWYFQKKIPLPYVLNTNKTEYNSIGIGYVLRDQISRDIRYAFLIYLKPDELNQVLKNSFTDSRISTSIVSPEGQVMASSSMTPGSSLEDPDLLSAVRDLRQDSVSVRSSGRKILRISPLENGWLHVTSIDRSYVDENLKSLMLSLSLIIIMTVLIIILITMLLSQSLTAKVSTLSKAMSEYDPAKGLSEETRQMLLPDKSTDFPDEIGSLSHTFIEMNDSIKDSMDSIMKLSLSEEKLRYNLLQAQINPHFLYNILGTVEVCIKTGKPDVAEKVLTDLSQFYRMTLRSSTEMIPIRDEMEISRLYLELEKVCHNRQLGWEFHLEEGIENYYICKFTLQPFLENCIHYGYSESNKFVFITVSAEYLDDKVCITITDNGPGMEEGKLKGLRGVIASRSINYSKHFGIGNVNWRLSSPAYGNGTVSIDCPPEGGTVITITFDQIEEFDE